MCEPKKNTNPNLYFTLAASIGLCAGYFNIPLINSFASTVADLFISLLKLVSLPIIFLSIVSTASGMSSMDEVKKMGKKVVKYTLLTTVLSAMVALSLYVLVNPVRGVINQMPSVEITDAAVSTQTTYWTYLGNQIPSNFIKPFLENQVISVLFLAILLSMAILALPDENRKPLNTLFSSLYAAVMKLTSWLVHLIPIALAAFIIRPFYTLIDMLETAINVWSDSCVAVVVDKEMKGEVSVSLGSMPQITDVYEPVKE